MLVFFTKVSLMEFQVKYLALFLLFSVIDGFEWFWMESLHKNIQLMLEFLKASFSVLHFSYYTLMTFLMMQQLELASELETDIRDTVDWDKKWLVDFIAGKTPPVQYHWFY